MDHQFVVDTTAFRISDLPTLTAKSPILVSDDDSIILELVKYLLERNQLTVMATLDPRDTLTICRTAPVSLLISDVMKPGMSGVDMQDHLRSDPVTASIPVVFVTTYCPRRLRDKLRHKIDGFLLKPFLCDELLGLVRELLVTRGRWERPASFDPRVFSALTDTSTSIAAGYWYNAVWTTRKIRLSWSIGNSPSSPGPCPN